MQPTLPPDPWTPIHSRIRITKVIAFYRTDTHTIRVTRRWHGTDRTDSATLPARDPACDTWIEVFGDAHRFRLCWYNPARHRIKRGYKDRGAYIEEVAPLPLVTATAPTPSAIGCTPLTDDL